jgi:acyl carrier protein
MERLNSMDEIREKLRTYITRELMRDPKYSLKDDESIIRGGLIDSFSLAELAVYIEGEFNVFIPDPDLTVEKMDTLNQIYDRVQQDLK